MLGTNQKSLGHVNIARKMAIAGCLAVGLVGTAVKPASALDLIEAIQLTVSTNPEIGEARADRLAIDHELTQARGLYLPQIDGQAEVGPEFSDTPGVRSRGDLDGFWAFPRWQLSVVIQQRIFDGFEADSEIERQAARVDAAAYRVMERSEFIGLDVVQAYLDIMRNVELVNLARNNVDIHRQTLANVQRLVNAGESSIADSQQAEERLRNAEQTLIDFETDLEESRIVFQRIVGQSAGNMTLPRRLDDALPPDVETAVETALENNPTIQIVLADLDVTYAELRQVESLFYPTLDLESTTSYGFDIAGQEGDETRFNVLLVGRYNFFRGGIDSANRQEMVARIGEARERVDRVRREVDELVRTSWNTLSGVRRRIPVIEEQVLFAEDVNRSYREQYSIGSRTLLDVLDAENNLFNARVELASAQFAELFGAYRVVASTGYLMRTLGIRVPDEAAATARVSAGGVVPPHVQDDALPLSNDYFR